MEQFVYIFGLLFVLTIILISLDDLIWDISYSIKTLRGKIHIEFINAHDIENTPPKMLAVMVAAYNEENVLESVIRNLIFSNQYPDSMYHIFLGVYPNDEGTLKVASKLEKEFENVHKIVHVLNGPSSKADNLNNVIRNIYKFESMRHMRFEAVIVHDSEDLVHPYEFKLENYLLEQHSAVQMPVFPLQEMPKVSNIFRNMITGSYADEFAENHYRLLRARTATGAFVPSAGTGFVIGREILEQYEDGEVFPVGSLTEDYKLSLEFKKMGYDVHYVLEQVHRVRNDGTVAGEFISTRSMFPSGYRAAVRQKTRWIYGITIQSFKLRDILKSDRLNFSSKYSLYRDWKAKFGNLLLGPGYLVFIYFLISLFMDLPIMYPAYSFPWYLMLLVTMLMVERQVLRFLAVKNVYGYKSAFISVLLPPLLPIRMVVGNIINFHATAKSWFMNRKMKKKKKSNKKPKWSKTDHEFLEEAVLLRFRRNVGDTLLYKGLIDSEDLNDALKVARAEEKRIGKVLIEKEIVEEKEVAKAVCEVNRKTFVEFNHVGYINTYMNKFNPEVLQTLHAVPIFKIEKDYVVITTVDTYEKAIFDFFGVNTYILYTTESTLHDWMSFSCGHEFIDDALQRLEHYINDGLISVDQGVIALSFHQKDTQVEDVLYQMGLLRGVDMNQYNIGIHS